MITAGALSTSLPAARGEPAPSTRSLHLDREALAIAAARDGCVRAMAHAAAGVVRRKAWAHFGFARLGDFARERLGRSGRWLRDLAALDACVQALPPLGAALTGADGGRPIGRVAALVIGRVAVPFTVHSWIARARALSVRQLRDQVRAARAAGAAIPPELEPSSDDTPGVRVHLPVPAPLASAFDEALDLFRSVSGEEATVVEFVEALVGEAMAAEHPVDIDVEPIVPAIALARVEAALEASANAWRALEPRDAVRPEIPPDQVRPDAEPAELVRALQSWIAAEEDLDRRLGDTLARLGAMGAWTELGFSGAGHYAEERLGIPRTTAEDRARLARLLCERPRLHEAYESGQLGFQAALLVQRVMGRVATGCEIEQAWLDRAREATIRRLRDEIRACGRDQAIEGPSQIAGRMPLSDAAWYASLHREPGTSRARLATLGSKLVGWSGPVDLLSLRLPDDLAQAFLGAVESARRDLEAKSAPEADSPNSLLAARTFSIRHQRVPAWVGLLALLEEAVATWDVVEGPPRRRGEAVYRRAGWRCEAPGCTSRRHLEDHHVRYRSRGGDDSLSNRLCLCRFHHQLGEHGGLASCRGAAPLAVLWRIGAPEVGAWYRNDRRV